MLVSILLLYYYYIYSVLKVQSLSKFVDFLSLVLGQVTKHNHQIN